jgi:hypothetical protein
MSNDWRLSVTFLAMQYVGVFVLVALSWPIQMAIVKLVAGWMSGAILGLAQIGSSEQIGPYASDYIQSGVKNKRQPISAVLFRLLAAIMVLLAVISISPIALDWVPSVSIEQILGAFILIGLGLLHLGFTPVPYRVNIGLLTVLAGFEILYAAVEISALVAGLLASVNLGLALIGAYLTLVPGMEGN